MKKAVLISIQPYWAFLIIARLMGWNVPHEKTVEVRKNFPQDSAWNRKTLIYCSKNMRSFKRISEQYQPFMKTLLGKVIGEFVCDKIETFAEWQLQPMGKFQEYEQEVLDKFLEDACLSFEEVCEYRRNMPYYKDLYGWHISALKIYDKPKWLAEFKTKKKCKDAPYYGICSENCGIAENEECDGREYISRLTHPPKSWCYVEEV